MSIFASRRFYCDFTHMCQPIVIWFNPSFFFFFSFLVDVLVSSLFSLHSFCQEPVQALVLSEPQPPGDKSCGVTADWQAGPETLEQNRSSHCFLQTSASQGCGNWWLNNAVYTHWELTIPDRTGCFSFDARCWEYVQSFLGPMPSTLFISSNIATFYKSPVSLISFLLPARG